MDGTGHEGRHGEGQVDHLMQTLGGMATIVFASE